MKKQVYWADVEYYYNADYKQKTNLTGGSIFMFMKAFDVRDCLERILVEIKKEDLILHQIVFITPYDVDLEWETEEEKKHYAELYNQALKSDEVIFDENYAYENE